MDSFSFALNDQVVIVASGEAGVVIGRAEYTTAEPSYQLRYRTAEGRAVEQWWSQDALARA